MYQQALDAAMKQFKALAPNTAVLLFSEDRDAKRIVCMAQVPQVLGAKHCCKAAGFIVHISVGGGIQGFEGR